MIAADASVPSVDVRYDDVVSLQASSTDLQLRWEDAGRALNDSVGELIALDTFQGSAATAVKRYFEEVHQTLLYSLEVLVDQLAADCASYYREYGDKVAASSGDRWPVATMGDAVHRARKNWMDRLLDIHVDLGSALKGNSAGIHGAGTSSAFWAARDQFGAMAQGAEDVANAVAGIEASYGATGSRGDDFDRLHRALQTAIDQCQDSASAPYSYERGSFAGVMEASRLGEALLACSASQRSSHDDFIKARAGALQSVLDGEEAGRASARSEIERLKSEGAGDALALVGAAGFAGQRVEDASAISGAASAGPSGGTGASGSSASKAASGLSGVLIGEDGTYTTSSSEKKIRQLEGKIQAHDDRIKKLKDLQNQVVANRSYSWSGLGIRELGERDLVAPGDRQEQDGKR